MRKLIVLSVFFGQFTAQAQFVASASKGSEELVYVMDFTSFDGEHEYLEMGQSDFKKRKPGVAFLLSFLVSGTGQFYNKQPVKGAILLGASIGGAALAITGSKPVGYGYVQNDVHVDMGLGLLIASSLYSMIDAPIVANKLNKESGISMRINPALQDVGNGKLAFGPRLCLSF